MRSAAPRVPARRAAATRSRTARRQPVIELGRRLCRRRRRSSSSSSSAAQLSSAVLAAAGAGRRGVTLSAMAGGGSVWPAGRRRPPAARPPQHANVTAQTPGYRTATRNQWRLPGRWIDWAADGGAISADVRRPAGAPTLCPLLASVCLSFSLSLSLWLSSGTVARCRLLSLATRLPPWLSVRFGLLSGSVRVGVCPVRACGVSGCVCPVFLLTLTTRPARPGPVRCGRSRAARPPDAEPRRADSAHGLRTPHH